MPLPDALLREFNVTRVQIAVSLGVTTTAVGFWCKDKRLISVEAAKEIERKFGIPKHRIRPDVWEAPVEPTRRARRKEPA